ncbi:MAG: hypothetical protein EXR52_04790 [Dehalococcoidia bacterium]|nr:hypothetical protein [Dehalococcoidia bacterium]
MAYGFGFLWAMVGHMLWELVLAKDLEQYAAFNGYLGSARSWTRITILSGLTTRLIMATALDPFAVVRDIEMAIKDCMTATTAELSDPIQRKSRRRSRLRLIGPSARYNGKWRSPARSIPPQSSRIWSKASGG